MTGKQQGLYGQIESMDENTARCFVRMALGGNVASIAELCLKPVSAKEYKDSSRILSKWPPYFVLDAIVKVFRFLKQIHPFFLTNTLENPDLFFQLELT